MSNVQTEEQTVANPHADKPNDTRLKDLYKEIGALGRESGSGRDALPKLALRVAKAAADGVIDMEKKHKVKTAKGEERMIDDAAKLYRHYADNESSKLVHDKNGTKANESKLRQIVQAGCMTGIDFYEVLDTAAQVRDALIEAKEKVKPAYAAFVDLAREQLKCTDQLTDDDIDDIVRKDGPAEKSAKDVLKAIEKKLDGLISSEKGPRDDHELVKSALAAVQKRLTMIMVNEETVKLREAAAKLGLTVS